jgi:hypothetical protein
MAANSAIALIAALERPRPIKGDKPTTRSKDLLLPREERDTASSLVTSWPRTTSRNRTIPWRTMLLLRRRLILCWSSPLIWFPSRFKALSPRAQRGGEAGRPSIAAADKRAHTPASALAPSRPRTARVAVRANRWARALCARSAVPATASSPRCSSAEGASRWERAPPIGDQRHPDLCCLSKQLHTIGVKSQPL